MYDAGIADSFELLMDMDENESTDSPCKSADEAIIDCINKFGGVDMAYLTRITGKSCRQLSIELKGTIFQDPQYVLNGEMYDPYRDWFISARYLSGNIQKKLKAAKKADKKYPGKFAQNIESLSKILPPKLSMADIHVNLGATWIPESEYESFITEFLHLTLRPDVTFHKESGKWNVSIQKTFKESVLNTITYGVRGIASGADSTVIKQYLTGIDIIEQTMNARTVKVYDYITKPGKKGGNPQYEPVLNKAKTVEAQEKQNAVSEGFREWIKSDKNRMSRFEGYYNEAFVGYTFSAYDGSFLKLPDLNPDVTFFKHQRNAIARILLSGKNVLLAHDVGTGKTYEMIAAVHELKRMGLSGRNMVVVPNNVLKATADAHMYLYPQDKIYVIYPKDFTPKLRADALKKICDGDYVAVYMAYSSFDMIVMSKQFHIEEYQREIKSLRAAAYNAPDKAESARLNGKADGIAEKLVKYISEEPECPWPAYDELGIDTLVVDEAHNYKNIEIRKHASGIVGAAGSSSRKCIEMFDKAYFTKRLIFATGTPLTNSISDLFAFQTYLQPATLELHRINTFDTWLNTFGQKETSIECDVDANSKKLKVVTRFASFHNLGELMSMFSQVCDFHHADEKEAGMPHFSGYTDVCVPKGTAQAIYIDDLSARTENIRNRKVSRNEDNMLKVTSDGRKAGLDIRLVDAGLYFGETEKNKISACAERVVSIYRTYEKSVQVVFSDIGTPKAEFNVYDSLKEKLMEFGIPESEISYVHDATTEYERAKMFSDMNKGVLRVVIGSTPKLGVGVNVQERLVALHHLSVPWRPADMVQREGRILRKGNTSKEVFIYRYITEGSFDAYSWQLLENKQKFISSFLSGTSAARDMDDIADAVLKYAEVKALAIGNPLIKKRVEISNLLERSRIASRARQRQLQELRAVINITPDKIYECEKKAKTAEKDYVFYQNNRKSIPNDEREAFGEELLIALENNAEQAASRIFDEYQGFDIILPANMLNEYPHVYIRRRHGGSYYCGIGNARTPLGCSKAIDRVLDKLHEKSEELKLQAKNMQKQVDEAKKDLQKGNPYLSAIERLICELDEVDKELEQNAKENRAS